MSRHQTQKRQAEEKLHKSNLEEAATDYEVMTDFRRHPGWVMVEVIMEDYARRAHLEFLAGSKDAGDYRAECRVLEFIKGSMDAVAEQGQAAARELLDRGWTE